MFRFVNRFLFYRCFAQNLQHTTDIKNKLFMLKVNRTSKSCATNKKKSRLCFCSHFQFTKCTNVYTVGGVILIYYSISNNIFPPLHIHALCTALYDYV